MIAKTFGKRLIHQSETGMCVYQNPLYRWLTFGNETIQTLIHRHQPQRPGLNYVQALTYPARNQPGSTGLLGLGGAGVAHALNHTLRFHPFDAVDISSEVISIAHTYFFLKNIPNINIICQNAKVFVETSPFQYQHLIIDLFNNQTFPNDCNTLNFFEHCHRILLPNGILTINLANIQEQSLVLNHLRHVFPKTTVTIPIKNCSNIVIIAHKNQAIHPLLQLIKQHPKLLRLYWDSAWGHVAEIGLEKSIHR